MDKKKQQHVTFANNAMRVTRRKKDPKVEAITVTEVVAEAPRRNTRRNSINTPIPLPNTPIKTPIRGMTPEYQETPPFVRRSRRLSQTSDNAAPSLAATAALKQNIFAAVQEEDDGEQKSVPPPSEEKENNSLMVNEGEINLKINTKKPTVPLQAIQMDVVKKITAKVDIGKGITEKIMNFKNMGNAKIFEKTILSENVDVKKVNRESIYAVEPMEEDDKHLSLFLNESDEELEENTIKLNAIDIKDTSKTSSSTTTDKIPARRKSFNKKNYSFFSDEPKNETKEEKVTQITKTPDIKISNNSTKTSSSSKRNINDEGLLLSSERNREKIAGVKKILDLKGNNSMTAGSSSKFITDSTTPGSSSKVITNSTTPGTSSKVITNSTTPGSSSKVITNSTTPVGFKPMVNDVMSYGFNKEKAVAGDKKTIEVKGILKHHQVTPFSKPKTNLKVFGDKSTIDKEKLAAAEDLMQKTPDIKRCNTTSASSKHIASDNKEKSIQKKTPGTPGHSKQFIFNNESVSERKQRTDESNKQKITAKKHLFRSQSAEDNDEADTMNASSIPLGGKPNITDVKFLNPLKSSFLAKISSNIATETNEEKVTVTETENKITCARAIAFTQLEGENKPKLIFPKTPGRMNIRASVKRRVDDTSHDVKNELRSEKIEKKQFEQILGFTQETPHKTYVKVPKSVEKKESLAEKKLSSAPKETVAPVPVPMDTEEKIISGLKKEAETQEKEIYPIENMQGGINQDEDPLTDKILKPSRHSLENYMASYEEEVSEAAAAAAVRGDHSSLFSRSWNKIIQVDADSSNGKIDTIKPMEMGDDMDITAEFSPSVSDIEVQEEEECDDNRKSDYIDDEAEEITSYVSGDSLDEEERQTIILNEIVDLGESVGSQSDDDDFIDDEDDNEDYEKDSFIVSSGEEEEEDSKEIIKKQYNRIKLLSDSEDDVDTVSLDGEKANNQQCDEIESLITPNKLGNEQKMASTKKVMSVSFSDAKEIVDEFEKEVLSFTCTIGVNDKDQDKENEASLMKSSNILNENNDKNDKQDNDVVDVIKEEKATVHSLNEKEVTVHSLNEKEVTVQSINEKEVTVHSLNKKDVTVHSLNEKEVTEDDELNETKTFEEIDIESEQLVLEENEENQNDTDNEQDDEMDYEEGDDDSKEEIKKIKNDDVVEDCKQLEKLGYLNSLFNVLQNAKSQSLIIPQSSSNNYDANNAERRKTICQVSGQEFSPSRSFIETLQEKKCSSGKRKRLSKSFSSATDAEFLSQDMEDDIPQHIHKKSKIHPVSDDAGESDKEEVVPDDKIPFHLPSPDLPDPMLEAANQAALERLLQQRNNTKKLMSSSTKFAKSRSVSRKPSPQKSLSQIVFKKNLKRLKNEKAAVVKKALKTAQNILLPKKNSENEKSSGRFLHRRHFAKEAPKQKKPMEESRQREKQRKPIKNIIKTSSGYFVERPVTPVNENRFFEEIHVSSGVMRVERASPLNKQFRVEPISPYCYNPAGQGRYIENYENRVSSDSNGGGMFRLSQWYIEN